MAKIQLTDKGIQGASTEGKEPDNLFDIQVPGLCLRVTNRGVKTWNLHYTSPVTKKRVKWKLGRYPDLSLSNARAKAVLLKAHIADGKDPQIEKRDAQKVSSQRQTVKHLADEYMHRHVRAGELRSAKEIQRRFDVNITPEIGAVFLEDLHKRDIIKVVNGIMDRDAPMEASRTFELCRAMVRWGVAQDYLDRNVMDGMAKPAPAKTRERILESAELNAVWNGLDDIERLSPTVRDVIRLLVFTGCRVGEICGLERQEVYLSEGLLILRKERVKNGQSHKVPLSKTAIEIVEQRLASTDSEWLFPRQDKSGPTRNSTISRAILRMRERIGVEDWTAHDLRRTWATTAAEMKVQPHIIAACLNHKSVNAGVTFAHYIKTDYLDERREAYDIVDARLQSIIGNNVISLKG